MVDTAKLGPWVRRFLLEHLVLKQASMERKRVPLDLGIFDSA